MKTLLICALGTGLVLGAPALAQTETSDPANAERTLKASFVGADGNDIGTAGLTQTENGVLIQIDIEGLPADSWVAFHVHETDSCDPQDGFKAAGGHFNPDGADHGFLVESGPHAGDMPNQHVGPDGTLQADVLNANVTLAKGETSIQGRALMIHAGKDDYKSQPSGDAGDRIACAVIGAAT
jgi:Cu-Zn family superoxide dismutase